ncbi:MAG: peptidylprolyl isomerase [Planctomycetaceae bacterium]|nr:peptidylprolyl isomerase [Planctomycetaceae bacterium]
MSKKALALGLSACVAVMLMSGCSGNRIPQGTFTPEQMQHIPLSNHYDLPAASGGMTLAVYSEAITAEEILNMARKTLQPAAVRMEKNAFETGAAPYIREAVKGKVTDILVYQEARKSAPENIDESLDKALDSEISRFVSSYGNNYALAEKKIKEMGMDWRSFRAYQKKLIMTQSYINKNFKESQRFSYNELVDFYNRIKDEQFCKAPTVEFSLIDIMPNELKLEQIAENQTREQAARQLAEELTGKASAGEDFAELARTWSHGPLAAIGGKVTPVTVGEGSLPKPYDVLETAAVQMQAGQVRGPIENDGHFFILKMTSNQPGICKSFAEVQNNVEEQMQFEFRQKQYSDFVNRLVRKANIDQMDRFVDYCTAQAYQRWGRNGTELAAGAAPSDVTTP